MDIEAFEALVDKAIEELPAEFRDALDNVSIMVEDWPTRQQTKGMGEHGRFELLGLYEGVPLIERGDHYNMAMPDTITLFRKPIEAQCRNEEEIRQAVRDTLLHEIAHHFGTGEGRIRAIERERNRRRPAI
jgi:predicted Zn-dependent protease with MMP-like domain